MVEKRCSAASSQIHAKSERITTTRYASRPEIRISTKLYSDRDVLEQKINFYEVLQRQYVLEQVSLSEWQLQPVDKSQSTLRRKANNTYDEEIDCTRSFDEEIDCTRSFDSVLEFRQQECR